MPLTIKQLIEFSWMSQAAYLSLEGLDTNTPSSVLEQALRDSQNTNVGLNNVFSTKQATAFTGTSTPNDSNDGFAVVSHTPNDSTGFSATVFKSNAANTNRFTIAVRGTEPSSILSDLLNADLIGVVTQGAAYKQTISAYRYYKQLTTAKGAPVSYKPAELTMMGDLFIQAYGLPVVGPGTRLDMFLTSLQQDSGIDGLPAGATVNFAGHSLGGHVATLLAGLVNQFGTTQIGDIATYNAPGMGGIFRLIDVPVDVQAIRSHITNIIGKGGMTVTPNVGSTSGLSDQLFIETASLNQIANHSIVKLSDSLAVYDLFARVDANLKPGDITSILTASSNVAENSLESAVTALGELFQVPSAVVTGNAFDGAGRDKLYVALKDLETELAKPANAGLSIKPFVTTLDNGKDIIMPGISLASSASADTPDGTAFRYALVKGALFAANDDLFTSERSAA